MKVANGAMRMLLLVDILMFSSTIFVTPSVVMTNQLPSFYVYEVTYVRQNDTFWSIDRPASLDVILSYWGADVAQEEIAGEIYDPQAEVTNISAMRSYPEKIGFRSKESNGSIGIIKEWIRKGCPVIVLQKLSPKQVWTLQSRTRLQ